MSWSEKIKKFPLWAKILIAILVALGLVLLILKFSGWFDKVAAVYVKQGDAAVSERNYTEAMRQYELALALKHLDGESAYEAYLRRGKILLGKRHYDAAEQELIAATRLRSRRPEAYLLLGQSQQSVYDYDAAVATLEQGIKQSAGDADIVFELGRAIFRQGKQTDRAEDLFRQALQIDPDFQAAYFYLALSLLENNIEEASGAIKQAITLSGDYTVRAQNIRARIADIKNRLATRINQNDDEALAFQCVLTGWAYAGVGETAAAWRQADKALVINSDYRDAWLLLGWTQIERRDYQTALTSLTEAYNLDPTFGQTQYLFALAETGAGEFSAAAKSFAKALALGYDTRLLRLDFSKLLTTTGDLKEAEKQLRQAYKMNPQDLNTALELVWFLGELSGQPAVSLELAQSLDKQYATIETKAILSLAYALNRDNNRARDLAAAVINKQPNNPLAYYVRGLATGDGADFIKAIDIDTVGIVANWAQSEIK
jgi:tetratricopeptide (TPR) repeat protein